MKFKIVNLWTLKQKRFKEFPEFNILVFGKTDNQLYLVFCNFTFILEV